MEMIWKASHILKHYGINVPPQYDVLLNAIVALIILVYAMFYIVKWIKARFHNK